MTDNPSPGGAGVTSPTHTTGINVDPPVRGWVVWFLEPPGVPLPTAVDLIARDCRARGLSPAVIHQPRPDGGDIFGRIKTGQALIAVAAELPSQTIPPASVVLVAREPLSSLSQSVIRTEGMADTDLALQVISALETAGLLPQPAEQVYTPEEEERLHQALDDLGYV